MKKRKIILDTDPGIDDAIAMAVLIRECRERVKLVLTSYGNTTLENASRNAVSLLSLMNADIPVIRGASKPAPGNSMYADASNVHGCDGLGGLQHELTIGSDGLGGFQHELTIGSDGLGGLQHELTLGSDGLGGLQHELTIGSDGLGGLQHELTAASPEKLPESGGDADYLRVIYDAIIGEGRVDYISLGPLTNLAGLIRRYPDVTEHIGLAVAMAGGIGFGNVTPHAEFNIYCDAESADFVFGAIRDMILVPLDITIKIAFDMPAIERIGEAGNRIAESMAAVLKINYELCRALGDAGAVMHDATAILAYLYPEMFNLKPIGLRVECGKERYGKCLPVSHEANRTANIRAATDFNASAASAEWALGRIANCIVNFE